MVIVVVRAVGGKWLVVVAVNVLVLVLGLGEWVAANGPGRPPSHPPLGDPAID